MGKVSVENLSADARAYDRSRHGRDLRHAIEELRPDTVKAYLGTDYWTREGQLFVAIQAYADRGSSPKQLVGVVGAMAEHALLRSDADEMLGGWEKFARTVAADILADRRNKNHQTEGRYLEVANLLRETRQALPMPTGVQ